jgi:UrcA family protein
MTISAVKVIATTVLAIVMSAAASHAIAEPGPASAIPSITVRFGDLNTASPEGIRALYARIRFAADQVCTKELLWYPTILRAQKTCYRAALDNVVARLNLPGLTALHRAAVGHSRPEPKSVLNR